MITQKIVIRRTTPQTTGLFTQGLSRLSSVLCIALVSFFSPVSFAEFDSSDSVRLQEIYRILDGQKTAIPGVDSANVDTALLMLDAQLTQRVWGDSGQNLTFRSFFQGWSPGQGLATPIYTNGIYYYTKTIADRIQSFSSLMRTNNHTLAVITNQLDWIKQYQSDIWTAVDQFRTDNHSDLFGISNQLWQTGEDIKGSVFGAAGNIIRALDNFGHSTNDNAALYLMLTNIVASQQADFNSLLPIDYQEFANNFYVQDLLNGDFDNFSTENYGQNVIYTKNFADMMYQSGWSWVDQVAYTNVFVPAWERGEITTEDLALASLMSEWSAHEKSGGILEPYLSLNKMRYQNYGTAHIRSDVSQYLPAITNLYLLTNYVAMVTNYVASESSTNGVNVVPFDDTHLDPEGISTNTNFIRPSWARNVNGIASQITRDYEVLDVPGLDQGPSNVVDTGVSDLLGQIQDLQNSSDFEDAHGRIMAFAEEIKTSFSSLSASGSLQRQIQFQGSSVLPRFAFNVSFSIDEPLRLKIRKAWEFVGHFFSLCVGLALAMRLWAFAYPKVMLWGQQSAAYEDDLDNL